MAVLLNEKLPFLYEVNEGKNEDDFAYRERVHDRLPSLIPIGYF